MEWLTKKQHNTVKMQQNDCLFTSAKKSAWRSRSSAMLQKCEEKAKSREFQNFGTAGWKALSPVWSEGWPRALGQKSSMTGWWLRTSVLWVGALVCQDKDLEIQQSRKGNWNGGWSGRTYVTSLANFHISSFIHDGPNALRERTRTVTGGLVNMKSVELKINCVERFWGFVYWMWSG